MRNNNNGLINGGYTNNHNVNQILYFNQEAQPVQLTPSPYLTSQTFIAPPQQIPYQPIYNSIPNYYNMGVVNYPTQTTALPYPPIIMKQNSFPSQILPTRLDVVDPNTGNNVNISRPTTPVALPKRRSTLQIIDPVSKNEIDVSKILNRLESLECHKEEDKKDFKFEFNIKAEDIIEEPIESVDNNLVIPESVTEEIIEDKLEIQPVQSEIIPEQPIKDDIEVIETQENSEIKNILEEQELKNILHEINQDDEDDDFTEVVNKKKKKQQAKLLVQEQKSQETKSNSNGKKENSRNQNGYKKDNRERNVRNNKVVTNDKKEAQISPNNSNEDKQKSIPNTTDKQEKTNSINRSGTRVFHNTDKRLERNNQHNDNGNMRSGRNENQYVNRNNQGNFPRNANQQKHLNNKRNENAHVKTDQNDLKDNEDKDANTPQNENRNVNIPRSESRNDSIHRNESRNANINRNESRNTNIHQNEGRNDNRNSSLQRNESRNVNIQRNGSRNASIHRNETRDAGTHRNESRNDSIHRNETRDASFHRNESRNANINRNESRNANIHQNEGRNDNRNSSLHRNESRNTNIHQNEGRNDNRNSSLHRNESRNTNIHQNDNRNVSVHQNEGRNTSIPRNDNWSENKNSNIQRNGSRNPSGQQNEKRYQNGQKTETIDDQQFNNSNGNLENRSSTLPRTQNFSRNDYSRNKFNSNNDNSQYDNRNRNNQGINRSYSRNDNYRSNNNRKENNNYRDDDSANNSRRGSTESKQSEQEFKAPFNKAIAKQPMNFQRAFRKSSSPLFSPRHVESDKTGKVSPLIQDSTLLQTNDDSNDLVEQLQELRNLEINDNDNQCADNGSTGVVLQHQSETDTVKDTEIPISENELSEQISVNETSNSVVEACVDEVDASSVVDVEEIIPSDETETRDAMEELKQSMPNEIQPEPTAVEKDEPCEDSSKELEIKTNEIVLDVEITDIKIETEDKELGEIEEIGRLTYYRDNLLALRGCQTLPEEIFLDPSLMDVITAKMQLINFLKKKDIFLKSNIPKTDYLDFTRKHFNIRPKRLIRSDNGYLPPQLRKDNEDKMNTLKRNIKSILNKMTPENFDICMNDLVNLDIDEEENMRCLIEEIFSKAIVEESYSSIYAKFCSEMSNARVGSFTFKTLLLKSCQSMFDKPMHLQLEEVKTYWENKVAEEKDERMKRLYESDIEEKVKKVKDKYFGNIRFFSELFLTNQLSWKIIIACAEKLLGFSKDNNSLEAACKLIQICGKQLEMLEKQRGTGDNKFSKVMNQFVALSNKMEIEPRIRFKLKDIVDMRDRGWELRGIQKAIINIPKTLDEIKEDKLKEDSQKSKMSYNNNSSNNNNNNARIRQIPSKSMMDTKKLLLNTQNVTENTVLGPSLRTQWNAGCQSKSNNNGFSTIPFRKHVVNEDMVEKPVLIKTQNKYAKFCDEIDTETTTVAQVPVENDDALSTELFNLIMNNLAEVDKWKELFNPVLAVEKWFALMFERKIDCRIKLGDYFYDLIEGGLLTFDQLIQGAMPTLETIDDLIDDVPKFWEFLAEFLERFIKSENSNISFFHDLFKDIDYETSVEKCLKLTKQFSSNRLNSDIVEDLFKKYQK